MGCAQSRAAAGAVVETGVPSALSTGRENDDPELRPVPVTHHQATVGDAPASWKSAADGAEAPPGRLPSLVSADSEREEGAEAVVGGGDVEGSFACSEKDYSNHESPFSPEEKPNRDSDDQTADRAKFPPKPTATKNAKDKLAKLLPPRPTAPKITTKSIKGKADPRKFFRRSSSVLEDIERDRNEEGDFTAKVVHIEKPGGKPIEDVYDGVHDGEVLGSGVAGKVRLVTHRSTGVQYAVKCLDLGRIETEEGLQQLREEIYIMCQLDHPNIVRLEEVYEDESTDMIYLVQELCSGKELFDRLDEQAEHGEARCAELVGQMLSAVRFLHSKGIVHRDLKCENFLFADGSPDAELRMIDFGLSKHFAPGEAEHDVVGTPYTVAPEVIRGCYDERCDLWAIGVIAFFLLCGDTPFGGCNGSQDNVREIRENILACNYAFEPDEIWDDLSGEAKDFVRGLLVLDPTRRLTAEEAQKSPWLQEWGRRYSADLGDEESEVNSKVVEALLEFREYTDMRKLLCEVLSFTLLPDQIERMRREFRKLDSDGLGEISLRDFKHAVSRPSCRVVLSSSARRRSSYRPLTEDEIESVFDSMRQHRAEARIHWHEFVAAGLCLCDVDERNIRLAFDRLDSDHKGYISFDNILDLSGGGSSGSDESDDDAEEDEQARVDNMREQWDELTGMCRRRGSGGGGPSDRITYEDFRYLMAPGPNRIQGAVCGVDDCRRASLLAAVSSAIQT